MGNVDAMAASDEPWNVIVEADAVDRNGEAVRLEVEVACRPGRVEGDVPGVGRFGLADGRCLEYVGVGDRTYVRTKLHRPGNSLTEPDGNWIPSYPLSSDIVPSPDPRRHALTGARITGRSYREAAEGQVADLYGEAAGAAVAQAAAGAREAFACRYVLIDGAAFVLAPFPTWRIDPQTASVELEAPVHAEAADRHLHRYAAGRCDDALIYLAAICDGRPATISGAADFDAGYDERNDDIRLCVAANAYLRETMALLVPDMPTELVRRWKALVDVERSIENGEHVAAREMLASVLALMDHAESAGVVEPGGKSGPDWSRLRTRLVLEGIVPSAAAPEAPGTTP